MPSSTSDFNPYLKWLGIRSPSPNHYQLLGIETFESDADVIVAAADRQMAHVRKYQNGPHSAQSQTLLNQLAAAKVCLLNAEKKLAYDAQLTAAELQTEMASIRNKKRSPWLALSSIVGLGLAAAVFAIWSLGPDLISLTSSDSSTPSTPADNQAAITSSTSRDSAGRAATELDEGFAASPPEPVADSQSVPATSENSVQLVGAESPAQPAPEVAAIQQPAAPQSNEPASQDATSSKDTDKEKGPSDAPSTSAPLVGVIDVPPPANVGEAPDATQPAPWEKAADSRRRPQRPFAGQDHAIAKLMQSLYDRNIEAADKLLDQVRADANDEPKRAEALRIEIVYFKMKEFWDKADQGLAMVAVGDTLNYRNAAVTVIGKTPTGMRLQAANGKQQDFDTARANIDADLAVALARANGEAFGIMLDVMCGVFLAIDRQGDLNAARELLKRAQENGVPVELLLARRASEGLEQSESEHAANVTDPLYGVVAAALTADDPHDDSVIGRPHWSMPTVEVRRDKLRMLRREAYREQFAKHGRDAELELARRLFQDANRSRDDADARYVMYEQAIRLAAKHGDAKTADTAIRALVYNFDCDEDAIRLDSLIELGKAVRDPEQVEAAVLIAQNRIQQLIERGDFSTARKYLAPATNLANRRKMPDLLQNVTGLEQRLSDLEEHLRNAQHQLLECRESPNDAAVHTILGLYQLDMGRDEKAQQHLLAGNHDGLARAAAAEQDMDGSAESQLAVADMWWQLCDDDASHAVLSRLAREKAVHWYTQALDRLEGVSKVRAKSRIRG